MGKGIWLKQFWCSTKTQKQEKEFTLGEDAEDTDPKVAFLHPAKGKDQSSEIQKSSPNPGRQSLIKSLILKLCNTPSTGNSLSQILLHSTRFKSLSSRSNVIRLFFFPLPSLTLICKNSCYCGRKLKSETSSTWSMSRLVRSTHLDLVKKDVTQSWRCRVVVLEVDLCFFLLPMALFSPAHGLLGSFLSRSHIHSGPLLHFIYIGLEIRDLKQYFISLVQLEEDICCNGLFL